MRTRSLIRLVLPVILACLGAACHIPTTVVAADFTGKVVGVLDGDTLEVLHNQHRERVRLSGIDCPEKRQAYGHKAKQAASALAFGKHVTIQTHGHDKYTRTLGEVILPDGRNLNQELVKEGWCWWYRHYSKDESVGALEEEARQAKRGLWADPNPIPPWEFRHPTQGRTPSVQGNLPSESKEEPGTAPMAIIGNRNSQVYHRPNCPNYTATKSKNRVLFHSEAEAEAAGYHRAKNCP